MSAKRIGSRLFAPKTKNSKLQRYTLRSSDSPVLGEQNKNSQICCEHKEATSELLRNNEVAVKRKGARYHDEEKYPGNPRDSHGRPTSSTEDYARGSTSDEYKRRMHEAGESVVAEKFTDDSQFDYVFKVACIVLALIIVILSLVLLKSWSNIDDLYEVVRNPEPFLQVRRFQFAAFSDEIDCSIHMKRRALQGDTPHNIVRQGLMCLYALAAHTVHERSSMQIVFSYRQTSRGMANAVETLRHTRFCYMHNTSNCDYRQFLMFMSGYAHINGTFRDSELVNVWMEPEVVDKAYHVAIWSRAYLNGTNFGYGNDSVKSRQFRLPPLFFRIAVETPDYEKMLADWNKRFPYINTSNLSVADTIVITENEAERAAEVFATNNVRRRSIEDNLFHYYLGDAAVPGAVLELVFPKPEASHTLSFLSAFIIKVVYETFKFVQPQNKAAALTLMSLNAQHIALKMLRTTREWSGDPKDPSLLDMWQEASDQIIYQSFDRAPPNITRNATDRVTTLLAWERNKYHEWLAFFELATPHCFDPTAGTGRMKEYAPFIDQDGKKSTAYSSAAGLVVMHKFPDVSQPLVVASAIGKDRTVEGVANGVLRILLLDETPGQAVKTVMSFVDHEDGRTYVTLNDSLSFGHASDDSLYYTLDFNKYPMITSPKRTLMLAVRHHNQTFMTLASSGPRVVYNYAAGY